MVDPQPPLPPCANCGTALTGPFCAQCGQHVADYHRSVWRFVTDFLDNTFCWDNKLLRTLEPLFLQPGGLTQEFMAGRRVRYVHPLRLFLFTSAVCLALLHFGNPVQINADGSRHAKRHPLEASFTASASPTASPPPAPSPSPSPSPAEEAEEADATPDVAPSPGMTLKDRAAVKASVRDALKGRLGDKTAGDLTDLGERLTTAIEKKQARDGMERFTQEITDGVRQRLSWVALGMLPIFALLLRGLYWQKDSFYFLHLVFSLHYHTFLLMFWTAYSWLRTGLEGTFLHGPALLCLLGVPAYLFLSLRRVYGGSARRTWTKVLLLGGAHLVVLFGALAAIGALALFSAVK